MSLYVLFLVLTAAILHASWNLLAKQTKGKAPFLWLQYVAGTILYLPFIFLQRDLDFQTSLQPLIWFSLSSAVLHCAYFLVLQKGYRSADLSVVYPLARGSGPLFSSIAAILFLHEPLKLSSSLGLMLIIAGVLVITGLSFNRDRNNGLMTGITYGTLTGLFICFYTLNDTVAIKSYGLSPLSLTVASSVFSTVLLFPFVARKQNEIKREMKMNKWMIIAIAFLAPASYMLVLEALKYAPLTVVAPARESSILIGVFMGSRVFNEQDGKRRLVASALILSGIVLLSFP